MEITYLVTGGAGFIGSHLSEKLASTGSRVLIADNLLSGYKENVLNHRNIIFKEISIQEIDIEILKSIKGIYHLAAQASVPKSIDDFYFSSCNNLLGTLKVFDLSRKLGVPVVYATSSAVYGNLPLGNDESEKYDIISPYAQDKLTMEHYAQMAWKVYKTASIGLRFFNVYGPRQDPTNPYSGVISIFIDRLLRGLPVKVNGGYQTRDFIYVSDIVDVLIESMNHLQENQICEVLNVGTGKSISIDDLLNTLNRIFKTKPIIHLQDLPDGDPIRSEGTYSKLENLLGISTNKFTPIDKGLFETIKYITKIN